MSAPADHKADLASAPTTAANQPEGAAQSGPAAASPATAAKSDDRAQPAVQTGLTGTIPVDSSVQDCSPTSSPASSRSPSPSGRADRKNSASPSRAAARGTFGEWIEARDAVSPIPLFSTVRDSALSMKFPASIGNYTLIGRSRAADATGFAIPELGFQLDAGALVIEAKPTHVFISHTHSDHAHMLTHLKSRTIQPRMYAPEPAVKLIGNYLDAAQMMNDTKFHDLAAGAPYPYSPSYHLTGVRDKQRLDVKKGATEIAVDVFACDHTVPCVGFAFFERRKKLKDEYKGLAGGEIGKLRKSGVEVSENIEKPMFGFCGDTTADVFTTHKFLLQMPLVICECTFIAEEHKERARQVKHTVWSELKPIVDANPNTLFVLTHFSHQYKATDVKSFFAKLALKNVVVWLE